MEEKLKEMEKEQHQKFIRNNSEWPYESESTLHFLTDVITRERSTLWVPSDMKIFSLSWA
jgi:hypothetical protein